MIPISEIIEDYIFNLPITYYYDKIIGNGSINPCNYISFPDYKEDILSQIRRNINLELEKMIFYEETSRTISTGECVDMIFRIINGEEMHHIIFNLFMIIKHPLR